MWRTRFPSERLKERLAKTEYECKEICCKREHAFSNGKMRGVEKRNQRNTTFAMIISTIDFSIELSKELRFIYKQIRKKVR